ncbi:CRISPR-associated endonuclease Cas2 [Novisyntrophococcus fermenticellae]|uniref:CRISPR-associated endonuclease Cas2 n=1 Tax=Novisyntrophococcus fermenticellae TaxID=2068655 RepID=UPI001E3B0C60|nr:CRISPR-associated endonuclease Cas2 [Novisyntrophococcus fermenticellae]
MYILITYDINVTSTSGQSRLRRVAKICENYGQRVQNSVFECRLNEAELLKVKKQLLEVINMDMDSLRFYRLGDNYDKKVQHMGAKKTYKFDDAFIV